jgi:hypothetical protein
MPPDNYRSHSQLRRPTPLRSFCTDSRFLFFPFAAPLLYWAPFPDSDTTMSRYTTQRFFLPICLVQPYPFYTVPFLTTTMVMVGRAEILVNNKGYITLYNILALTAVPSLAAPVIKNARPAPSHHLAFSTPLLSIAHGDSTTCQPPLFAGRVFLETSTETRAFGNVWVQSDAIIFEGSCPDLPPFPLSDILSDVCEKLEGESIVGEAIKDTPIWCLEELPPSPSSRSPNRSSPSPTSNTTPMTPLLLNGDWREPIRRMLRSLSNVNIRISAKPPTNSSPSYSIPSSPIPLSDSSSIAGSLPLGLQSRPPITVQIPGASTVSLNVNGLLSPSSYKTARSTPLSQRPPAAEPSPRSQAALFPELQFTLSAHPTSAPVPSTAAPLPTVGGSVAVRAGESAP